MRKQAKLFTIILLIAVSTGFAQEKEKDIGTQVVNVVKPYTPTISDAFKVKATPTLNDSVVTKKKLIKYSIFSVPVASTFVPSKGKAQVVQKAKRESLFNTNATVAVGNYNSILADFYTSREISRNETFDVSLNHHSSQGGIEGVRLDDKFFNTKLEAAYLNRSRDMEWGASGGFQHQIYNWYGLSDQVYPDASVFTADERQTYYNAFAEGYVDMNDALFEGGKLQLRRFWDEHGSTENRVVLAPKLELPIAEEKILLGLKADYLSGEFDQNYANDASIKYSYFQVGASPSLVILRDDLTVHLGATFVYGMDTENSNNNFYIYPNVTASYRLVDEYVIAYGGIEGKLKQNSFYGFTSDNRYVSPTLNIMPTDQQYDGYVGVKGKLHANVSYNLRGSYIAENNKPMFRLNSVNGTANPSAGYAYGNSFDVVYDDVKTIAVFGELNIDINRNFTLGVNAEVFDYNTDTQQEAWNLPVLKGSLFADYQINDHWFLGANIFYTGERKDYFSASEPVPVPEPQVITLDDYIDANAHLGYRFNNQLTAFVKANNIANNDYARWSFYNVMGFQIMAGVTYKFDLSFD